MNSLHTSTTAHWGSGYLGHNQSLRFYPDMYANYWAFPFDVQAHPHTGIKVEGVFPRTRFFNITLYDDVTTDYLTGLLDVALEPDPGSCNPYRAVLEGEHRYTLYIVPKDTPAELTDGLHNMLTYDPDLLRLNLLLRYYIPEGDPQGGVELPRLSAFDSRTGESKPMPERAETPLDDLPAHTVRPFRHLPILFFLRSITSRMYPNPISQYLYAPNVLQEGQVALFSFRPPGHPRSPADYGSADVRYWSVNIGDNHNTHTYHGYKDSDTVPDAGGFVHFIIADPGEPDYERIKAKVETLPSLYLLPWRKAEYGPGFILLYRQTIFHPDYQHAVQRVEQYNPFDEQGRPLESPLMPQPEQLAHLVLGEWGPLGQMMPAGRFLSEDFHLQTVRQIEKWL